MSGPKYSLATATSVVVANMIGTGVFTCLGFQLLDISHYPAILLLWLLGGLLSLIGAFCYAELGSIFPNSGGEYRLLNNLYHPLLGFLSGWTSAIIGFSAPIALAAYSFSSYLSVFAPQISIKHSAAIIILLVAGIQSQSLSKGSQFQKTATLVKVFLIVLFIVMGLFFTPTVKEFKLNFNSETIQTVFSWPFAAAMFWASFAYSGWNASSYIAGEIKNPVKNLPKSLIYGSLIVSLLYFGLNFVFLKVAPFSELKVQMTEHGPQNIDTGNIAGRYIFGPKGSHITGLLISLLLISSISAMTIAGSRVIAVIGSDYTCFSFFAKLRHGNTPVNAIGLQTIVSLILLYSGSFDHILRFTTFVLILFYTLTVSGLFIKKIRLHSTVNRYKSPGYPLMPLLFVFCNVWFMIEAFINSPLDACIGLAIVLSGWPVYIMVQRFSKAKSAP